VKLYFDVSADVQEQRMAERRQSPWRGRIAVEDFIRADDPVYQHALEELRVNTDTRWSPWRTIDGDNEEQAALAALEAIAEAWSKAMPADPPQLVSSPRVA
jgi:polyphosphate kinase 2 (PPK2 family)